MSSIAEDLQAILDARYGKDVRQSIHDAIEDIDEIAEDAAETVSGFDSRLTTVETDSQQTKTDLSALNKVALYVDNEGYICLKEES